jgi:hypothetical protein
MSNPFTSVNRSERHLQTDHSQGPEYLCRDHDGLEGPLMSSAPVQITEGSCVPMSEAILQFRVSTHRSPSPPVNPVIGEPEATQQRPRSGPS